MNLIKEEDGGEYEVRAVNEMGTAVTKSTVVVQGKLILVANSPFCHVRLLRHLVALVVSGCSILKYHFCCGIGYLQPFLCIIYLILCSHICGLHFM